MCFRSMERGGGREPVSRHAPRGGGGSEDAPPAGGHAGACSGGRVGYADRGCARRGAFEGAGAPGCEAGERPDLLERRVLPVRFRPDEADGGGAEPDGERSVPGHARLRGAGADTGVGCRRPRRPVRARLRAVRVSGRPASVRRDLGDGGHVGADARATCRAHGPQAGASRRDRRGAGQGAGQGAGGAVRRLLRAGRGGAWSSRARRRGTAGVARAGVAASAREARRRHRGAARRRRGRRRGRPVDARLRLRRHRLGGRPTRWPR